MDILSIIFIAVGLSMDSFGVSIVNGCTIRQLNANKILLISLSLAFFQALMPVFGWMFGLSIQSYIHEIDHWIAFILLSFIGIKMIIEGMKKDAPSELSELKLTRLLGQSLATSIDAFVVGISFSLLQLSLITPVLIIGGVTFLFSLFGLFLGKFFGKIFGRKVDILGGLILIGIGIKILVEHLYLQ